LVREPEGKRPTGRSRRRWEDNIKKEAEVVGCWCADWIHPVQYAAKQMVLVNTVTKLRVPWNVENILTSWGTISFSRWNVLDLTFGRYSFRISAEKPAVLPEVSRGFSQSLQANPGKVSWLTRDGFLPSTFQFTIYQSYHPTLCRLGTDSIIKLSTDESGP
jgi:hypothetical protein